ncbi:hypothetical protein Tco_0652647 [Tanacetum coccineum]|uniref:Uncharacterized protein n=1 Tax=Tanacetum coccineum TaxID=301880 RepID=A0ABQ4WYH6_9ASTR
MELHDVSYGIKYVARPLLLFFSFENRLLLFRYREYDLAHLKLVFEFSIYNVWISVQYGVSNGLDTAYYGFLGVGTTFDIFRNIYILYLRYGVLSLFGYGVLSFITLWSLVSAGTDTPYLLDGYGVLVFRIVIFKISSFKLQNARLLLCLERDKMEGSGVWLLWAPAVLRRVGSINPLLVAFGNAKGELLTECHRQMPDMSDLY